MQSRSTLASPILFVAPHRTLFFSGGVALLTGFALWAWEIVARNGLVPAIAWTIPAGWMHALIVLCTVFPFFMFGFALTAMPRWQGAGEVVSAAWLGPWRLLAAGWAFVVVGLWVPGLLAFGLICALAGWLALVRVLRRIAFNDQPDALHARTVWWALCAGAVALCAWIAFALTGKGAWARMAVEVSVWWFLLPVFFTVCHRMVPFFSSNVIEAYVMVRPRWALGLIVGASVVHGALAMSGLGACAWIVDLPASAAALWLSWQWRLIPSLRVPLLGMLHVGFAWLGVALFLFAIQGISLSLGRPALGLAPLHALCAGFFGSVLLAMVSRVTLGHSGSKLTADRLTWGLFIGLEGVVVVRIVADLLPGKWSGGFMLAAVLGWIAVFAAWGVRYLPLYWRPRSDGRPG